MRSLLTVIFSISLAVTAHAAMYVSEVGSNKVWIYDSLGKKKVHMEGGFSAPEGLVFDRQGNLFASSFWNARIYRLTPTGEKTLFASAPNLQGPHGMDVDADGNLYVADTAGNAVKKFLPDGTMTIFAADLYQPYDVKFDRDGNLFVAVEFSNSIVKIDSQGNRSVFLATGLNAPSGLAFDKDGNLFVSNASSHRILRIAPDGTSSVFADTGISNPLGMAFDNGGDLYVCSWADGKIVRFAPNGESSVYTDGLVEPSFLTFGPAPLTVSVRVSQVEVSWEGQAGKNYQVQYSSVSTPGVWTNLGDLVEGINGVQSVFDTVAPGAANRIYRAVALEP
jgi:sugar lactone lactonase YvrE